MKNKEHKHADGENIHAGKPADVKEPAAKPDGDATAQPGKEVAGEAPQTVAQAPAVEPAKKEFDDRLLRLHADFDNFRKRTLREKAEIYQRANEDIFNELLPVLDHLDMALKSAYEHKAPPAITDGFRLVAEQLLSSVGKFGLTPFDVDGKPFDPMEQAAVSCLPSDTVPENVVMTQTRRGYKLGGRMLRPAEVVVSSGKTKPPETVPPEAEGK